MQNVGSLQSWVDEIYRKGYVAVDTETTSLDQSRAELVGISLCVEPGRACYIPVGHINPDDSESGTLLASTSESIRESKPLQIPLGEALEVLRSMLNDPSILKIGHNIKYDMVVLSRYGTQVSPVDDTMLLSYVLEGGSHGHGMDELAELYLGHTTIKYKEVTGTGKAQVTFDKVPLDQALTYAAEDADVTMKLHQLLKPRLVTERMGTVYETIERPLISVLAAMEAEGIKVDLAQLKRLDAEFSQRLGELEQTIHQLAGHPFNVGSPKQLGEILFEEMGLEGGQKGKAGSYTTSASVLEFLASQGHPPTGQSVGMASLGQTQEHLYPGLD